jgi:hypothetical protein
MSNVVFPFWQELRKLLVDRQDGTHAERVEAYPPVKLITDDDGDYARIRVDAGQTGFFAGREARTIYEFSIEQDSSQVIKVVAPVNTIVQTLGLDLFLAELRLELVIGGTEGGTFGTPLPIFKTNTMSTASAYIPQVTMATGGTHTGGTIVDLLRVLSGSNANKATVSGATESSPQGFPAGTFYIRLINIDGNTANGIFRTRWEERPTEAQVFGTLSQYWNI